MYNGAHFNIPPPELAQMPTPVGVQMTDREVRYRSESYVSAGNSVCCEMQSINTTTAMLSPFGEVELNLTRATQLLYSVHNGVQRRTYQTTFYDYMQHLYGLPVNGMGDTTAWYPNSNIPIGLNQQFAAAAGYNYGLPNVAPPLDLPPLTAAPQPNQNYRPYNPDGYGPPPPLTPAPARYRIDNGANNMNAYQEQQEQPWHPYIAELHGHGAMAMAGGSGTMPPPDFSQHNHRPDLWSFQNEFMAERQRLEFQLISARRFYSSMTSGDGSGSTVGSASVRAASGSGGGIGGGDVTGNAGRTAGEFRTGNGGRTAGEFHNGGGVRTGGEFHNGGGVRTGGGSSNSYMVTPSSGFTLEDEFWPAL